MHKAEYPPRVVTGMSESAPSGQPADESTADTRSPDENANDGIAWLPSVGLSDDGILLFFAGAACLLAATTASIRGQPRPIVVLGVAAGAPGMAAFLADVLTDYVPSTRVHLLVGGLSFLGTGYALQGPHYANAATLGAASALVLWRYFDVEYRDAEQ